MKKVSFDFDSTLSNLKVQKYAKELVDNNYQVWIVTGRYDDLILSELEDRYMIDASNTDLYKVAKRVGISDNHIHFCNKKPKYIYLNKKGFLFHLDDDKDEIKGIKDNISTPVVDVTKGGWKDKCNEILGRNDK